MMEDIIMKIKLIVTKSCSHCNNIKRELEELGVEYEICYVEDNPDLVAQNEIRHSPNIMVDGVIVARELTTEGQLKRLLNL